MPRSSISLPSQYSGALNHPMSVAPRTVDVGRWKVGNYPPARTAAPGENRPSGVGFEDHRNFYVVSDELTWKARGHPGDRRWISIVLSRHDLETVPIRRITESVRFPEPIAFTHVPAPTLPDFTGLRDHRVQIGVGRQDRVADIGEFVRRDAGRLVIAGRIARTRVAGAIENRSRRQRLEGLLQIPEHGVLGLLLAGRDDGLHLPTRRRWRGRCHGKSSNDRGS